MTIETKEMGYKTVFVSSDHPISITIRNDGCTPNKYLAQFLDQIKKYCVIEKIVLKNYSAWIPTCLVDEKDKVWFARLLINRLTVFLLMIEAGMTDNLEGQIFKTVNRLYHWYLRIKQIKKQTNGESVDQSNKEGGDKE